MLAQGREGLAELIELLMARECALASLDVSYTSVDVARLVQVCAALVGHAPQPA
jgi:hypothetical protein